MAERFLMTADQARLRIYRYSQAPGQFTPSIQPVDSLDVADSPFSYLENLPEPEPISDGETEFSVEGSVNTLTARERDSVERLAEGITIFMQRNPNSTWDLAATSSIHAFLVDALPDAVRRRLNQVIPRDLVDSSPADLREQFALA
ncbi:MAG TPA: host attachment protein [Opitutaceae bacterium]|nr:host attachment protein [Opitutaceae bacterium]